MTLYLCGYNDRRKIKLFPKPSSTGEQHYPNLELRNQRTQKPRAMSFQPLTNPAELQEPLQNTSIGNSAKSQVQFEKTSLDTRYHKYNMEGRMAKLKV